MKTGYLFGQTFMAAVIGNRASSHLHDYFLYMEYYSKKERIVSHERKGYVYC